MRFGIEGGGSYEPEGWLLYKSGIFNDFRVFGGWVGRGFTGVDTYQRNSGIVRCDEDEDFYYFYGNSGSCYKCSKNRNHLTSFHRSMFADFLKMENGEALTIEQFKEEWLNDKK